MNIVFCILLLLFVHIIDFFSLFAIDDVNAKNIYAILSMDINDKSKVNDW